MLATTHIPIYLFYLIIKLLIILLLYVDVLVSVINHFLDVMFFFNGVQLSNLIVIFFHDDAELFISLIRFHNSAMFNISPIFVDLLDLLISGFYLLERLDHIEFDYVLSINFLLHFNFPLEIKLIFFVIDLSSVNTHSFIFC